MLTSSGFTPLAFLPLSRRLPDLQGTHISLAYSPSSLTPAEVFRLASRLSHCCLLPDRGLYRFTLACFGSHAPLPTLTSRLTALMPRLCTGCLLRFPGIGLSPIYVMCAELAHRSFRFVLLLKRNEGTVLPFRFKKNLLPYSAGEIVA